MTPHKETNGKLLSEEELKAISEREQNASAGPWDDDVFSFADCQAIRFGSTWLYIQDDQQNIFKDCDETGNGECGCYGDCLAGQRDDLRFIAHSRQDIPALLSDREARIQRNREGIEKMFAKMNELDTPKRGELHLLLISLFS